MKVRNSGVGSKGGRKTDLDGIRIINKKYAGKTYEMNGDLATKYPNGVAGYTSTPTGYTWHHVEDSRTMTLVPSDLHGAVRHTGGASLIRKGIRP
ncbi:HNH endonuclease signature motif containing protein [Anaerosporobacter sp.]